VRRVERRAEVLDRRERLHGGGDVVHGPLKRGVGERLRLALDEDDLRLRVELEARVLEDLVGLVRLADVRVLLVDVLRPHGLADHDRREDEREPAEDRRLPVARAPAAHPGREVVRALQR
jgi:hypothetical protein